MRAIAIRNVRCWGSTKFGQLGNGEFGYSPRPLHVDGFEGAPSYVITGIVDDAFGADLSGVSISSSSGHSTITDASGYYVLDGLSAGAYTITPSKSGYTFSPSSKLVTVPPDWPASTSQAQRRLWPVIRRSSPCF